MESQEQKIQIILEGIDKNLSELLTQTKLLGNGFTLAFAAFAIWGQAFNQIKQVASMVLSLADAYGAQEVAENRLMAVMKAHGIGTKGICFKSTKNMPTRCVIKRALTMRCFWSWPVPAMI